MDVPLLLSSDHLHLHEISSTPLPSIELLDNMAPRRASRIPSSEMGTGNFGLKFNRLTGRPIRQVRKAASPFVDSACAISDDETTDDEDALPMPSRKRRRSASPELSIHGSDAAITESEGEQDARPMLPPLMPGTKQLTLSHITITVPQGHRGPIMLQIDPEAMMKEPEPSSKRLRTLPPPILLPRAQQQSQAQPPRQRRAGFLDLPAELRNDIYRRVFVSETRLDFAKPQAFGRSAALLRTCRQVHTEARSILYGENQFFFNRRMASYGSFWFEEWSEVGFRAVHQFVKSIGPINLGLLRHVHLQLEDATPSLNPVDMSHEARRFVNDDVLMSVLRSLGDYSQLQTLRLNFHGRRKVEATDSRFLEYLTRIHADTVNFVGYPIGRGDSSFAGDSRQASAVRDMLLRAMTRRHKLFE